MIDEKAFAGVNKVKEFKITKYVNTINSGALSCVFLKDLFIDSDNEHFILKNNNLYNKDLTELIMSIPYNNLDTLKILDGVYIHNDAFLNNHGPKKIKIGKNVKNINSNTFKFNRLTVEKVEVSDNNYKIIDGCLYNEDMTELLLMFDYSKENYTFPNTFIETKRVHSLKNVKKIIIPENIIKIADKSFYLLDKLEEVIIEDESSLEYIGNDAFNGCFNLKNIKLPKTVDYIGSNAFNIHYDANIYLEHESIPSAWESSWNFNFANVILQEKKENIVSINEVYIDEKSPARNAIKIYLNMIEFLLENKGLKYREIYLIILGAEVYGRFLQFDDINLLIKSEKFIKDLSSYFNPQIKKYGESYKMLLSLLSSNHRYAIYLTGVGILNIFYFLNKEDIALSYLLQASSLNEKLEIELGDKIEQYDTIYSNFIYEIEKYITSIIGTEERPILNNAINTMKR